MAAHWLRQLCKCNIQSSWVHNLYVSDILKETCWHIRLYNWQLWQLWQFVELIVWDDKALIISLETTSYETIHEIQLTLACHLGGATLHSAVVSLNQHILLFDGALHDVESLAENHLLIVIFHYRNISARLSDLLMKDVCCLRPRESMVSRFATSSSMTCLRRASRELP